MITLRETFTQPDESLIGRFHPLALMSGGLLLLFHLTSKMY